jgi:IclR family acetate operon transcriptional repressor
MRLRYACRWYFFKQNRAFSLGNIQSDQPNSIYIVRPVYKALQLLIALGQAGRGLTLAEICARTQLPKTTTFKYLHTLRALGFVTHDARSDQYRVGMRLWELGQLASEPLALRETALPSMTELQERFNETVNLGVLDQREVIYVEMVESRRSLRMQARIGARDPAYSTALGKAILAFLPEEEWREHLPARLMPRTAQTITALASLRQELIETRTRGFAYDRGENEEASRCVGAPIFGQRGRPVAAISVSAPAVRFSDALEAEVAAALVETARAISRRLGYQG